MGCPGGNTVGFRFLWCKCCIFTILHASSLQHWAELHHTAGSYLLSRFLKQVSRYNFWWHLPWGPITSECVCTSSNSESKSGIGASRSRSICSINVCESLSQVIDYPHRYLSWTIPQLFALTWRHHLPVVSSLTGGGPRPKGYGNTLGLTHLVQLNGALTCLIEFGAFLPQCFITSHVKQDAWSPSTSLDHLSLSLQHRLLWEKP